jgi:hypothetical protein
VAVSLHQVEESEEDKLRKKLPEVAAEPPEVEWWDKPLLDGGAYYTSPAPADQQDQQEQQQQGSQGECGQEDEQQQKGKEVIGTAGGGLEMRLRVGKLTRYVEHPIPLDPPDEGPPPAPQPLKLTKRWVEITTCSVCFGLSGRGGGGGGHTAQHEGGGKGVGCNDFLGLGPRYGRESAS